MPSVSSDDAERRVPEPDGEDEMRLAAPEHAPGQRGRGAEGGAHEERRAGDEQRQDHGRGEDPARTDRAREAAGEVADADSAGEQRHPPQGLDLRDLLVGPRDLDAQRIGHDVLHHEPDGHQHHGGEVAAPSRDHGGEKRIAGERGEGAHRRYAFRRLPKIG